MRLDFTTPAIYCWNRGPRCYWFPSERRKLDRPDPMASSSTQSIPPLNRIYIISTWIEAALWGTSFINVYSTSCSNPSYARFQVSRFSQCGASYSRLHSTVVFAVVCHLLFGQLGGQRNKWYVPDLLQPDCIPTSLMIGSCLGHPLSCTFARRSTCLPHYDKNWKPSSSFPPMHHHTMHRSTTQTNRMAWRCSRIRPMLSRYVLCTRTIPHQH